MTDDAIRRASRDDLAAMRARGDHVPTRPAVERWLWEGVAPVYDAMAADPGRALSAESVFDEIRTRHVERLKASR